MLITQEVRLDHDFIVTTPTQRRALLAFRFYNLFERYTQQIINKTRSKDLKASWDSNVCSHSAVCVNNLPGAFNLENKPWVDPNGASVEDIKALIGRCPSGALPYKVAGELAVEDSAEAGTTVTLVNNGPLRLKGEFQIVDAGGKSFEHKQVVSLCRCGASKNKPFFNGTHKGIGFEA